MEAEGATTGVPDRDAPPRLRASHRAGVTVALGALRQLPVDILKVDKAFVELITVADDGALVHAVVQMAERLGLDTLAEGIEDVAQLDELRSLGCRYGQGYLFGRSVVPAEAEAILAAGTRLPAAS